MIQLIQALYKLYNKMYQNNKESCQLVHYTNSPSKLYIISTNMYTIQSYFCKKFDSSTNYYTNFLMKLIRSVYKVADKTDW